MRRRPPRSTSPDPRFPYTTLFRSGSSEWFAIDAAYAPVLRERVLAEHDIDIYSVEGNWFPDPKWLDELEIPYMVGIQRPGDVVILKGDRKSTRLNSSH